MLSQAVVRALHKKQKLSAVVLQAAAMFPELGRATLNSTNLHHTLCDRFKGNRFCKHLSETFEFRWSLELCKARVNAPLAIQRKSQSQCLQTNTSVVSLQNCQVVFLAILDLDSLGPFWRIVEQRFGSCISRKLLSRRLGNPEAAMKCFESALEACNEVHVFL